MSVRRLATGLTTCRRPSWCSLSLNGMSKGVSSRRCCIAAVQKNSFALSVNQRLQTLTFISCLGHIQNGDYVSIAQLGALMGEMPLSQNELQRMKILSPLILLHSPSVKRLHETVPHKMPRQQPKPPPKPETQEAPKRHPLHKGQTQKSRRKKQTKSLTGWRKNGT